MAAPRLAHRWCVENERCEWSNVLPEPNQHTSTSDTVPHLSTCYVSSLAQSWIQLSPVSWITTITMISLCRSRCASLSWSGLAMINDCYMILLYLVGTDLASLICICWTVVVRLGNFVFSRQKSFRNEWIDTAVLIALFEIWRWMRAIYGNNWLTALVS